MLALHAGPAPAPRRQLFVGTALVGAAILTLMGGMLATWMRLRTSYLHGDQASIPRKLIIPEVPTNVMLIAFLPLCLFGQWAVYSARRDDRAHTSLALGLTALMGLAVINAMIYSYTQITLPVRGGAYNSMFYAITGTMTVLLIIGIAFTVVCLFRYLVGRSNDSEIVSAHALFWYVLAAAFAAVWFVVFVTKCRPPMFTTGSKLLLGGTVLSALTAVVWGVTSSGASGYVGVIGLVSLALAFGLLFGVNTYARDCNVPVSAPDAATVSAAARQPAGRGVWPAIVGLGIGGIALGTFTKPIVFKAGIIVVLAGLVEWLVQAWSERASADEAYNASLRKRVLHPLEMPLLGAIGVAVMIYSFSRIMLFLSKQAGPVAFIIVGVLILAFATMFALQPTVKRGVIIGVCAIGAIGLVGAGAAMAISGQRTIDRHPTTSDDDAAQCLRDESDVLNNEEYEEIERHSSERVAAKSSPMAEIVLKDGKLSASIVGIDGPQNTITVARSNPVNLLFTNRDSEKSRLTAFAGTEVTSVNDVEIKTDRLTCTTLLKQGAQTLLTVTFPKSSASAAPDAPFKLFVPGLDGQEILVTVP